MNAAQTIQNEILALRRIQTFEGFAYGAIYWGPGMWDFDRHITIELNDGLLVATVDFYSQDFYRTHPDEKVEVEFDYDVWEDQKFHIDSPATRENFHAVYKMCRGLINGRTIVFLNGDSISRESYLAEVAKVRNGGAT